MVYNESVCVWGQRGREYPPRAVGPEVCGIGQIEYGWKQLGVMEW